MKKVALAAFFITGLKLEISLLLRLSLVLVILNKWQKN